MGWILFGAYVLAGCITAGLLVADCHRRRAPFDFPMTALFSTLWPIFWIAAIVLSLGPADKEGE